MSVNAQPINRLARHPAVGTAARIGDNGTPAPQPAAVAGKYQAFGGDPPAEAIPKNHHAARHAEAYGQAVNLKPGEWFVWTDAPKRPKASVSSWKKRMKRTDIYCYVSTGGKTIVRRETAKPPAPRLNSETD